MDTALRVVSQKPAHEVSLDLKAPGQQTPTMKPHVMTIAFLAACSGGIDRSPPTRDVGLPPVPAPPTEVDLSPSPPRFLPNTNPAFIPPEGCEPSLPPPTGDVPLPWVRLWTCAEQAEPVELGAWQPAQGLPKGIYHDADLEWVDTWRQGETRWQLTRTVGSKHLDP